MPQILIFDNVNMYPFNPKVICLLGKGPEMSKHGSFVPFFNFSEAKTTFQLRTGNVIPLHLSPSMFHVKARPEKGHQREFNIFYDLAWKNEN